MARREDAWKAVKDVIRNEIDGQPQKVIAGDDNGRRFFMCLIQARDDALKAYGMLVSRFRGLRAERLSTAALAGRNWHSFTSRPGSRPASILTVAVSEHREPNQSDLIYIAGPSGSPVAWEPARSSGHRRNSSSTTHSRTSSNASSLQASISPAATSYGLPSPSYAVPMYSQPSTSTGQSPGAMPMAPASMTYSYLPSPAMDPRSGHPVLNHDRSEQGSGTPAQTTTTGHHWSRQPPARVPVQQRRITIRNLPADVSEGKLEEQLQRSLGDVRDCTVIQEPNGRTYAFITFAHASQAEMAVEKLHKSWMFGREISVTKNEERGPTIADGSRG